MKALFDLMNRACESAKESVYQCNLAADEERSEDIERRATQLYASMVLDADGNHSPDAMDEAIGDLCCKPETLKLIAKYYDSDDNAAIGTVIAEHIAKYWDERTAELAEDQIEDEAEKARDDCAAERAADHEFDRRFA